MWARGPTRNLISCPTCEDRQRCWGRKGLHPAQDDGHSSTCRREEGAGLDGWRGQRAPQGALGVPPLSPPPRGPAVPKGSSSRPFLCLMLPKGCRMPGPPRATTPMTLRAQGVSTGTCGPGRLGTLQETSCWGEAAPSWPASGGPGGVGHRDREVTGGGRRAAWPRASAQLAAGLRGGAGVGWTAALLVGHSVTPPDSLSGAGTTLSCDRSRSNLPGSSASPQTRETETPNL